MVRSYIHGTVICTFLRKKYNKILMTYSLKDEIWNQVFCWFQLWNHWKSFEMNKEGWKTAERRFQPAFGCPQHPKAGRNTQQSNLALKVGLVPMETTGSERCLLTRGGHIKKNTCTFNPNFYVCYICQSRNCSGDQKSTMQIHQVLPAKNQV